MDRRVKGRTVLAWCLPSQRARFPSSTVVDGYRLQVGRLLSLPYDDNELPCEDPGHSPDPKLTIREFHFAEFRPGPTRIDADISWIK